MGKNENHICFHCMKSLFIISLSLALFFEADSAGGEVQFNRDIRPILSENCFQCHGFDSNTREADLRLDQRGAALRVVDGMAAIVPGNPEKSLLIERINSTDRDDLMPPPESEKHLTQREKDLLEQWIKEGAEYQKHWAYIAPVKPEVPENASLENPIDRLIADQFAEQSLAFAQPAVSRDIVRRLSFDLTGLPPKPELVEEFVDLVGDESSYNRLVDQLINSPQFGERFAVYWLDLVRWADTMGFHSDDERYSTPYRDYIINAFNSNMPYDRFTREQLAGDLLPSPTKNQLIASGYNRMNQVTGEGGAQPKEYRAKYMADKTRNVSSVWLASTMGCAECHDHKFDPFTMKDFYSMAAFFADLDEPDLVSSGRRTGIFQPALQIDEEIKEELDKINREIAAARASSKSNDEIKPLTNRKASLERKGTWTVISKQRKEPRMMRILPRGNFLDESGPEVQPAIPEFLGTLNNTSRLTRLDLANWIVDESNPLTARVMVNRLWYLFFGRGLSPVLDDLGYQAEWPSHPELLDWLAVEFVQSNWDLKHMIKLILTSKTYRQTSNASISQVDSDPQNKYFSRQNRQRLQAEFIRDMALSTSGLLYDKVGGKSAKPYQPDGYWSDSYKSVGNPHIYRQDKGGFLYRRGLYTFWKRTFLHPEMLTFDAPNREECVAQRAVSNTPLQALVLLNDPTFVEAARALAVKTIESKGNDFNGRLNHIYRSVLQRKPTRSELKIMKSLYEGTLDYYSKNLDAANELATVGELPTPNHLNRAELASWVSLSRVLINLHEAITRP